MRNLNVRRWLSVVTAALMLILAFPVNRAQAAPSTAPLAANITITNNLEGTDDVITVTGVNPGDTVRAYASALTSTPLGMDTVPAGASSVQILVYQLGKTAGTAYVTVATPGNSESSRTAKPYVAEPLSTAPNASNITVTNNLLGTPDTIAVTGLAAGETVRVYASPTAPSPLGAATVAAGSTAVTVSVNQIGRASGSIYVAVRTPGKLESPRTAKSFSAEPISSPADASTITVTNNFQGTPDSVSVVGLLPGDVVKVYNTASAPRPMASVQVAAGASSATVSIYQLGKSSGTAYITVKSPGKWESIRTPKPFTAEPTTPAPVVASVTVVNNQAGTPDTVTVTGLTAGDLVRVYRTVVASRPMGYAVVGAGATSAVVGIDQVGGQTGTVHVTVTTASKQESTRTPVPYTAEPSTTAPPAANITVVNNPEGKDDTVGLTGLTAGDVVRVFITALAPTPVGMGIVPAGQTALTVNVPQLGRAAGTLYVSVAGAGTLESLRTPKPFTAEPTSTSPAPGNVVVTNNPQGTDDTVAVSGVTAGDVIRVYPNSLSTSPAGYAVVPAGATAVTVLVYQLGSAAGTLYVTATTPGKLESSRTPVAYSAEPTTVAPATAAITVVNNPEGKPDTIAVTGLTAGDTVRIYVSAKAATPLGTATVPAGASSVTVYVTQLGRAAGQAHVAVVRPPNVESPRTAVSYAAEPLTAGPSTSNITVTNNFEGTPDTVTVNGLAAGDLVKVFGTATDPTPVGTGVVAAGAATVTLSIHQLGPSSGNVYVSVTTPSKNESSRAVQAYTAEPTSTAPLAANITITNNIEGTNDTVGVSGLAAGDVVRVYASATDATPIGYAVEAGGSATVNIYQLGVFSGTVYVTTASSGKQESARTAQTYLAE